MFVAGFIIIFFLYEYIKEVDTWCCGWKVMLYFATLLNKWNNATQTCERNCTRYGKGTSSKYAVKMVSSFSFR